MGYKILLMSYYCSHKVYLFMSVLINDTLKCTLADVKAYMATSIEPSSDHPHPPHFKFWK